MTVSRKVYLTRRHHHFHRNGVMNPQKTNPGKTKRDQKKEQQRKARNRWIVTAFVLSFVITAVISVAAGEVSENASVFAAIPLLLFFIFLGIFFDVVGLAVATADPAPFHSMAARRLRAGKKGVWLISNSARVSSFCNDIVGDICGVVSGATGTAIAARLFVGSGAFWLTLCLTSLIAALTVGCKAIGKEIALRHSGAIVTFAANVLCGFRR